MSKNQLNEHIKKIMSKTEYVLESPSYRAIIDDDFKKYDDPTVAMSGLATNPADTTSDLVEADPIPGEEPQPEADPMGDPAMGAAPDAVDSPMEADPMGDPMAGEAGMDAPTEEPTGIEQEPSADDLQNEIIKQNIEVMKQLNQKVKDLESGIDKLSMQNDALTMKNQDLEKDVEEVREPTNVEKLVSKKEDSHPYYYGLNDMWDGNWFQARRDELGERGMKKLEDGSYIADFDEINKMSDFELDKSFND